MQILSSVHWVALLAFHNRHAVTETTETVVEEQVAGQA